ncbi:FAD-dependent oxidoreductase [Saccharopolyspora sp. WRP15-2]|uniref:FAD-dependent oxidoreductase n=1 Tax=Saccharopolyspora oryzae TaxID=2997343 RepID=A0ABT4UTZ6_9PSEU|nr:FAD-dependent oxidoreductase [Saccharopolyspora oryzae]MDA3625198.1 FAD-dependent oxidoreductase [Saccharopolyspora oryzae]
MPTGRRTLSRIFEPIDLGSRRLRSRVYVPAHQPGLALGQVPGDRYVGYHRARAHAGVGMQITGATPVSPSPLWGADNVLSNYDDRIIPGYQRLAAAVHDEGGTILAQLAHAGATELSGGDVVAPDWYRSELTGEIARPATSEDLHEIVGQFGAAAARCRTGGLDGVEITMAHGLLLGNFLSPYTNTRSDEFGGDPQGRLRLALLVLAAVREACGPDLIVGVRISGDELVEGGIGPDRAASIAAGLAATGQVDYLSVIAGNNTRRLARVDHWPPTPAPHGLFRHLARAVRAAVDIPVAAVGRITTPELAEDILADGDADLVGMVRAHVADPDLLAKARAGKTETIRPCVGANLCINRLLDHQPVACVANPDIGLEAVPPPPDTGAGRSAVVVGGGPAGLEAARRLALRGCEVTLYEREHLLGGQLRRWSTTPSRQEFRRLLEWWERELDRLGVTVRLGVEADAPSILADQPDHVLVATGSLPVVTTVPGDSGVPQLDAFAALDGITAGTVVVHDDLGKLDAMLVAERLAESCPRVVLVTSCVHAGEGEGITTLYPMLRQLGELGVEIIERARPVRVVGRRLELLGTFGERRNAVDGVDALVGLAGSAGNNALESALRSAGVAPIVVGDALRPRRIADAVTEAAEAVRALPAALR